MTYKNCLYLALGLGVGCVATYFISKSYFEKKCWSEYQKLVDETFSDIDLGGDIVITESLSNAEASGIRREKPTAEEKTKAEVIGNEYGYKPSQTQVKLDEHIMPYLIAEEDYSACGYACEQVTWYPAMNILADENGVEIADVEGCVGSNNLSAIDNDSRLDGVGYVRNDDLNVDYQITISYDPWPPEGEIYT